MAKLTLNDITGGYQTATAFNANNALIEAALENTLSRDGTAPNNMDADFDMNSYDINNVNDLNVNGDLGVNGTVTTAALVLNGEAITTETTLSGGLTASEVTFAGGTLQDALDDDYVRNDEATVMTQAFTVQGLLTADAGVAITGNLAVSGTVDGIDIATRDAELTTVQADVVALDTALDITEGSFAPTLTAQSSGTISVNAGADTLSFTKIGNRVFLTGQLYVDSVSTPIGVLRLGNLPYARAVATERETYAAVPIYADNLVAAQQLYFSMQSGANAYAEIISNDGATGINLSAADQIQATTTLNIDVSYITDS